MSPVACCELLLLRRQLRAQLGQLLLGGGRRSGGGHVCVVTTVGWSDERPSRRGLDRMDTLDAPDRDAICWLHSAARALAASKPNPGLDCVDEGDEFDPGLDCVDEGDEFDVLCSVLGSSTLTAPVVEAYAAAPS